MPSNIIIYLFTLRRGEPLLGATMRAGILNEQKPFLIWITVEIYIITPHQSTAILTAFSTKIETIPPKKCRNFRRIVSTLETNGD